MIFRTVAEAIFLAEEICSGAGSSASTAVEATKNGRMEMLMPKLGKGGGVRRVGRDEVAGQKVGRRLGFEKAAT